MQRFVILAAPRTGSNLLCTLLNSHPKILCHHEVFNPDGIFTALTHRDGSLPLGSVVERDRDPLAFLQRVWATGHGHGRIGFKWTRGQNPVVLAQVLADQSVGKIVLRRRNRIKTFVSERIAHEINQWEVYRPQQLAVERPRVRVELAELRRHVSVNEEFYRDLDAALGGGQRFVTIDYEDLFADQAQARLLRFLGLAGSGGGLRPASIKQNSTDLRDLIENFAELAEQLRGSDLEAELHDCST